MDIYRCLVKSLSLKCAILLFVEFSYYFFCIIKDYCHVFTSCSLSSYMLKILVLSLVHNLFKLLWVCDDDLDELISILFGRDL